MLYMGVRLPLELPPSLTAVRNFWSDEGRSLSLGSGEIPFLLQSYYRLGLH